jgi:phenylpropionate dioxygenase-like ring-hydroxylating dioxygenase large terminal subunit
MSMKLVDHERGLISRDIFAREDIYNEEIEKLFTRAWLFVGHDSLIPNPGDYFVSRMGGESVILCRDRAKRIHALLNTCRHRGMRVCLYDQGNTQSFVCPYHSWTYGTDGKLIGVPHQDPLYKNLDKSEWSLIEVPRIANYKGTLWASWDPQAPDFLEYLGGAKEHLDMALDRLDGQEGGTVVFGGVHKWIVPSNWKLPAENFCGDSYHNPSHRSVDMIGIGPSAAAGVKGRRDPELDDAQHLWISFPAGHGIHSAIKSHTEYFEAFKDNKVVEQYYRQCHEERARRLGEKARLLPFVGTIFPNCSFHGRQPRALCVWHPHGPTSTEIWRFFLVDRDAPTEVKDMLRHFYMRYSGPAGMTEQDDMENWNYATAGAKGAIARRYPFNYQQSMNTARSDDPVPGTVSTQMSEENARRFYQRWWQYLQGADWNVLLGRET